METTKERPELIIKHGQAVALLRSPGYVLRLPVDRKPLPFTHVYQHPTEKWWTFGDNSGQTHLPPTLVYRTDSGLVEVDTDEPVIETNEQRKIAWWVFKGKADVQMTERSDGR